MDIDLGIFLVPVPVNMVWGGSGAENSGLFPS